MIVKHLEQLYRALDKCNEAEYVYWDSLNENFRIFHTQCDEELSFMTIKLSFDKQEHVYKRIENWLSQAVEKYGI